MENPDSYIKEILAAYRDLFPLFDANMNNMFEMEENVRMMKVFGHVSDAADIAALKGIYKGAESISLEKAVNASLQFRTGTTTTAQNDTVDEAIKTTLREEL